MERGARDSGLLVGKTVRIDLAVQAIAATKAPVA
jgi:hypothetical protein